MGNYVWDGKRLTERRHATIDVEDRGFNFGDGIYEVFRVYGGKTFEADAHWKRFVRSAGELRIGLMHTVEQLNAGVEMLIRADNLSEGIVYLQATRGVAPRAHGFPAAGATKPTLTAFTKPLDRPTDAQRHGTEIVTMADIRWLRCDIKSLNLLPNVLAKQKASEAGASEAVLHRDGIVTEGSSSNLAIVKDGVIRTHPANHLILHGITRGVVLQLAGKLRLPVAEEAFTLEELRKADEAFLLSTTVEVMPVVRVDGQAVGSGRPGPISRILQEAYEKLL